MDYKTVLVSVAASVATVAVTLPMAVNFVTLQASSPGSPDTGHINVSGNVVAGRVGVNDTPGLARVQIKETGGLQALRSISGTGVAVYGQSNATTGLGAGGYFTSASAGGRAVVGEQMSASGNTVGGLFFTHSANGVGVWGRHNQGTGTSAGVFGETLSASAGALGVLGQVTSTSPGSFSVGVRGVNKGTAGNGIGVYGSQDGGGYGVYGKTSQGIGVYGDSDTGFGVLGAVGSGRAALFMNDTGPQVSLGLDGTTAVQAKGDIQRDYGSSNYNCVPAVYGWVAFDGEIKNGTGNFTVNKIGTGVYDITIGSSSYSVLNGDVATANTLSFEGDVIRTTSNSGNLRFYTLTGGNAADSGFLFVAYLRSTGTLGPNLPDTGGLDDTAWARRNPKAAAKYMAARNEAIAAQDAARRALELNRPSGSTRP
ncbi:MAG: hypothetical protein JST30_12975 [Armatimonadetes bacterium]|nr:hypothetical protein [Armatimonadota bacterium]